ncbi:MAG: asparagine synthase C-terminal domain-containing protein, partial [Desulfovibrionaceae bacterium]|nr:asparagine synthase C-terminal domain-containing protein [Desulfovibrionaceae bacterium]
RLPLLDHRIAELCASIPPGIKFKGGRSKALFRKAVRNLLPASVLARKDKMGFPVPLSIWYQGALKEYVHDILLSQKALSRGLYNERGIRDLLGREQGFSRVLWGLLCMELWHRTFVDHA